MIAALALVAVQAVPPSAADDPLAGIPGVAIEWYDVDGRTPAAIRASMNARRPTDTNDGTRVDALTRWRVATRWTCRPMTAQATFSATILLPRLADPRVPAGVRARWDRMVAALLRHESGHVRYPHERLEQVAAAMRAAGCDGAGAAGQAAIAELAKHDAAYDAETDHGKRTGATFP